MKKILKLFPCQPSRKNIHEKKSPLHVQKAIALTHNFNSLSFQLHARNVRRPGLLATKSTASERNRRAQACENCINHAKAKENKRISLSYAQNATKRLKHFLAVREMLW